MPLAQRPYGPSPTNVSGQSVYSQNIQAALAEGVLPALQSIISATEAKILNPLNSALALSIPLPPKAGLEQIPFDVYISGYIKTTASGTVALGLYADNSATVTSGNLLHKTASATTQNTATAPFWFHAKLIYDSVSGKLTGQAGGSINNVIDPEIALTNVLTGISDSGDPVLNLSLSITSSGALTTAVTSINVQAFSAG